VIHKHQEDIKKMPLFKSFDDKIIQHLYHHVKCVNSEKNQIIISKKFCINEEFNI